MTDQKKLEKVIKSFEICTSAGNCLNCPYANEEGRSRIGCTMERNRDALKLLKMHVPNAMTSEEADDIISRKALLHDLSYCAPELWQDSEYIRAKIEMQPPIKVITEKWLLNWLNQEERGSQIWWMIRLVIDKWNHEIETRR